MKFVESVAMKDQFKSMNNNNQISTKRTEEIIFSSGRLFEFKYIYINEIFFKKRFFLNIECVFLFRDSLVFPLFHNIHGR